LQTIRTSTAFLITAFDSKKKLEPKHAFEEEREAAVGWVVAGRPRGWSVGGGAGREAEWVGGGQGAGVATQLLGCGCLEPCVFSDLDKGPS
jgi:hypothetical protein